MAFSCIDLVRLSQNSLPLCYKFTYKHRNSKLATNTIHRCSKFISILISFLVVKTLGDCEDALSPFREGSLKEETEPNSQTAEITPATLDCNQYATN